MEGDEDQQEEACHAIGTLGAQRGQELVWRLEISTARGRELHQFERAVIAECGKCFCW